MTWHPGTTVAERFRILAQVGEGSIGSVWRCVDARTQREVALKLVAFGGDEARERRFGREAKATMRLRSPNVVEVLDAGTVTRDGVRVGFMALEMLEGETLAARLRRDGAMPPRACWHIFEQIGRAVSLAHSLGLIHRDLKPANLFLCDDGVAKILDFGLTKSFGAPLVPEESALTRVGDMLGTPLYMSPEQAQGSAATDHRTDLWALGVMVFECLCGERPFIAKNLADLLDLLEEAPIVVPSTVSDVPPGFDAWFARAVNRDVQARFQSASALLAELGQVLVPELTRRGASSIIEAGDHTALRVDTGEQRTVRRVTGAGPVLFGRGGLLLGVENAFASHARIVTLCGGRGVGRGAIAHAHATAHRDVYLGGSWRCSFGGIADVEAMWRRLATALDIVLDEREPVAGVGRSLAQLGKALLVLERVERIREVIAPVVAELLRCAPQLRVVATSDLPLAIGSERVFEVRGLAMPDISDEPRQAALASAGMRLFAERAELDWARRPLAELEAAARAVRAARGNPLAISLFAAGVSTTRLGDVAPTFDGSSGGDTDRTTLLVAEIVLRELPAELRRALLQLSCFRGAFTMEAAEHVLDVSVPVADAIRALLSRAWLSGGERYVLHPVIRKLCSGRLREADKHETLALFARHGEFFARAGDADTVAALSRRGGTGLWRRAVEDAEDVSAALERAQKRRAPDVVARCCRGLGVIESELGRHGIAARLFLSAMSSADEGDALFLASAMARVRALLACGRVDAAGQLASRMAHDRPPPSERERAEAYLAAAEVELARERGSTAFELASRARATCGALDVVADADVLRARALPAAEAAPLLESAVGIYRTLGESRREAVALEALGRFDEAITIQRRLGARLATARALTRRAAAARDPAAAERDRREAAALLAELGADLVS